MHEIWHYFRDTPLAWLVPIANGAIWIAAVGVIWRSPKFLRKWLWLLLTLFQLSSPWGIGPYAAVNIRIPLGPLYVLWFWRFGRSPTQDEIAGSRARRGSELGSPRSVAYLCEAYLAATAATAMVAWLTISGDALRAFAGAAMHRPAPISAVLPKEILYGEDALAVGLVFLMFFLSVRPYWWGKLLCWWAGLAWMGFGIGTLVFPGNTFVVGMCMLISGIVMIFAGVAHQLVDPRFGGSYLRAKAQ